MNSLKTPLAKELDRLFSRLNNGFFKGELPLPTHVSNPEKKVVFKFVPESYLMVVGANFADAGEDVVLCYLHEMIHIWNVRHGVVDCTSNSYHNKKFLDRALDCGFYVARSNTKGWSKISLNAPRVKKDNLCEPIPQVVERRDRVLASLRINAAVIADAQKKLWSMLRDNRPKQCFLKYICQCSPPHNSIRSGRRPNGPHALHIQCLMCGANFVLG